MLVLMMVRLVVSVGAWEGTPTRGRGALVEARSTLLLVSGIVWATTTLACESLLLHHLLLLLLSLLLFIEGYNR